MAARPEPLILASASLARAQMLHAAGLDFSIEPAEIDETLKKRESRRDGDSPLACALVLATEKAVAVSQRHPAALVVGADQILAAGDEWYDKPHDIAEARRHLQTLRGRTHRLATAVCIAQAGVPIWRAGSEPILTMRSFSDAFLDAYVAAEGEALLGLVGAYRIEGRGLQLFARIDGDHFAILGLPLLELLGYLRERGALTQ